MAVLGAGLDRLDAHSKVTGDAVYPGDIQSQDMLHALVVFTDQPHARLVSLDTEEARHVDGVVEVVTAEDIPVNEYGQATFDQPVLIGTEQCEVSSVPTDVSRWEADQVAVVVAETRSAALKGAQAIHMEWKALPVVGDLDEGLVDQTLVHPETGSNAYFSLRLRKGDTASVDWGEAAAVIEATYEVPYQEHAYLQPEAAVGYIDESGRVTVEVAGQWAHEDQAQIAHALGLPLDQVRVIYPAIGGAFGGREDVSLQIVIAATSLKLHAKGINRPVRIQWSREESIVGHHKRHRGRIQTRWAADERGRVRAVEADIWLDAGAYNYTSSMVLGNLHVSVTGPYEIPNARVDSVAVYTNTVPGGAFRGFGGPQAAFVAENQMNKLAAALGIDPVEIRRRNTLRDGSQSVTMAEMPLGVSLPRVIEDCATGSGWGRPALPGMVKPTASLPAVETSLKRGRGFACAYKNVGYSFGFRERCEALVELRGESDDVEQLVLYHAGADIGQGSHTVMAQIAAEAAGIDVGEVEVHFSDTATSADSGSTSASRMTLMAGNSILGAIEEAQKSWNDGDRPARGRFNFVPPPTDELDPDTGAGFPHFAYGYVAQAVDLVVDIDTGHVRIERVVCANDVGKAINPTLVVGQIEGAIVQAHGYAITENLRVEGGRVLNPRLSGYLIPGIGDIPEQVESIIVECPDPVGPFGARGMAEMPMLPLAPAICAALFDATGVWFDEIPLTPDRVAAGLRRHGVGGLRVEAE